MQFKIIALAFTLAAGITAMPTDANVALETIVDDSGYKFEGSQNVRDSVTFSSRQPYPSLTFS